MTRRVASRAGAASAPTSPTFWRAPARKPGLSADAYERESITTPQAFIVPGFEGVTMPQLGLRPDEIDAVVAFLLAPR